MACTPDPLVYTLHADESARMEVSLDVPILELAVALDTQIEWASLETDLWGRPGAPITELQMTGFHGVAPEALTEALLKGSPDQRDVWIQFFCVPTEPHCSLNDFTVFAHGFKITDYYGDPEDTWLLSAWAGNELESLAIVVPGTEVSGSLGEATMEAVGKRPEGRPWPDILDWSELKEDVRGFSMEPAEVSEVRVGAQTIMVDGKTQVEVGEWEDGELWLWYRAGWLPMPAFVGVFQ